MPQSLLVPKLRLQVFLREKSQLQMLGGAQGSLETLVFSRKYRHNVTFLFLPSSVALVCLVHISVIHFG